MPDTELGERAGAALARACDGGKLVNFRRLEGGHSGITCLAELRGPDGPRRFVVKATPPGRRPVGRHDVLRQAAVLSALGDAGVRGIPHLIAQVDDDEPFFVMQWCPGDAAEPVLGEASGLADHDLRGRARTAAALLAGLHAVDPAALGIGDDPIAPLAELERWMATMQTVDPDLRKGADAIVAALRRDAPSPGRPCIVHGDYRLGNLLCSGDRADTIIDWEIWSVGDARVDLAWLLLFCDPANFPGIAEECAMPEAAQLRQMYAAAGGEATGDLAWFEAAARYKMAAVMGNNLARHRAGRHHDPFQESLPPTIRAMLAGAAELLGVRPG